MRFLFWRGHAPVPDVKAERADEAQTANLEAQKRWSKTHEALRAREAVVRRNHIADDIGKAYRIIHGRG